MAQKRERILKRFFPTQLGQTRDDEILINLSKQEFLLQFQTIARTCPTVLRGQRLSFAHPPELSFSFLRSVIISPDLKVLVAFYSAHFGCLPLEKVMNMNPSPIATFNPTRKHAMNKTLFNYIWRKSSVKLSAEKIPPRKVLQLKLQSSDATILLVFSLATLELECIINSSTFAMRLLQNFTRYMINHWILMDTGFCSLQSALDYWTP